MKKLAAMIVCVLVSVFVSVSAQTSAPVQSEKRISLGLAGIDIMDYPKLLKSYDSQDRVSANGYRSLTFSVFGAYKLSPHFSLQAELLFNPKNGSNVYVSSGSSTIRIDDFTYPSLDIPVLLRLRFHPAFFLLGLSAGPYLSVPLAPLNDSYSLGSSTSKSEATYGIIAPTVGYLLGGQIGLKIKAFSVFLEYRYNADLTALTIQDSGKTLELLRRYYSSTALGFELELW